jgi:hypothetical protein
MKDYIKKRIENMSKTAKAVAAIVMAVGSIAGTLVAADQYVADETELVGSITELRKEMKSNQEANQKHILMIQYDFLTQRYFAILRELKITPHDQILKDELEENKRKRREIQEKLGL